jgi:phosphatidylserine/phosphatidylglycerophosphate/cardiolipin synthase-like enzyme
MYEFQRQDLAWEIMNAHDRGVEVTAIMDPSERSSRRVWTLLRQAGITVVAFPVEPQTIDHVKLLIVDSAFAIVGGINWGRHSEENRDYDLLASGPVVANLERIFEQDLAIAGRPAALPEVQPDRLVQVLVTRPGDGVRAAVLAAISEARSRIDIEMFVLSDRLVLESLLAAVNRGVRVRVLLDSHQRQNLDSMASLRTAGASVHLYRSATGAKLHAKLGIFDGERVIFGSCNWSRSGFTRNHELDLEIASEAVTGIFLRRMEIDWSDSLAG